MSEIDYEYRAKCGHWVTRSHAVEVDSCEYCAGDRNWEEEETVEEEASN